LNDSNSRSDLPPSATRPRISILIPTLNAARTLELCLTAIRNQDYPADKTELIIADAGSTDETCAIATRFNVAKIVKNPLQTGEAGKAAAAQAATGDILVLIDSDNILPEANWLTRMTAPFADPDVFASEPLEYTRRQSDSDLTRYFAMLGMNDPLNLFIGNYDRYSAISRKWTGLNMETADRGDWLKVRIDTTKPIPTIGANGFLIRRSALEGVHWHPYWFDVDVVREAAALSANNAAYVAKVKTGIVHLYCDSLETFARKQKRRIRDFLYFSPERARVTVPGERRQLLIGIAAFSLATILVFPLIAQRKHANNRIADPAWRLHGPVCRITLCTYAAGALRKLLGFKQAPVSRDNWRQ